MSTGLPYLQKLKKSELTGFAETSNLQNYLGMKKAELETALDDHLRSNSTAYSGEPTLGDYYKRLETKARSPVKRIAQKVSDVVKSDEDDAAVPAKKARRKTKSPEDEATDTESPISALVKTPAKEVIRRSSAFTQQINPPSPAVVADAIDQQTKRIRTSISHAYERSQIHEYSDYFRELLSSSVTVNIAAILLEAYGLRAAILPNKVLTEIPPIAYLKPTKTPVNVPDLFQLLTQSFWAPFSLWLLISLILPATVSYFINLPLKQIPHHNYATRRASLRQDPKKQFDPFIFNLAKGLISYLVLAQHFQFGGLFQHYTLALVNEAIPGGYKTILTSTGLAAAISLYEAVLKK